MKIKINREDLIKTLGDLSTIIKDSTIRPAISGAKIITGDGEVTILGTTIEFNYIGKLLCDVEEDGEVVFKIPLILEYIKLLDDKKIELVVEGSELKIGKATFSTLEAEDYPIIEKNNGVVFTKIPSSLLLDAFDRVTFAASISIDNLAINAVRLNYTKENLEFVGTDSFRLAYFRIDSGALGEGAISIPLESVNYINRLLKGSEEEVTLELYNENILIVKWGDSYIATKLIGMGYPEYREILKSMSSNKVIELRGEDLKKAIKKVFSVARMNLETKNSASFDFKGNKLTLTSSSGRAKITQKLDTIKEGEDIKVSLNLKYLSDFTSNIKENIVIKGSTPNSMFIISEGKMENYIYLLMPVALRD